MIRLELKQDQVRAGERLEGRATWISEGGKQPRKVDVVCQQRIMGKRFKRTRVVDMASEPVIEGTSQLTVDFDFGIPRGGPLSYTGKLFNVTWEVVVRIDLPFAFDQTETRVITVIPRIWDAEEEARLAEEGEFDEDWFEANFGDDDDES